MKGGGYMYIDFLCNREIEHLIMAALNIDLDFYLLHHYELVIAYGDVAVLEAELFIALNNKACLFYLINN